MLSLIRAGYGELISHHKAGVVANIALYLRRHRLTLVLNTEGGLLVRTKRHTTVWIALRYEK
mgnify:CR=1 FL=1